MSHTLLLADDSVTIQRVIELTFADEDIRVVAVGDGKEAIARITADPPDIVLADTGMPERDGYEVASFIKQDPALAHIPVVLLTGAFEPVDGDRAREVGCDGVLVKPFEPQVVISRVKELLGKRSAAAPAPPATALEASPPPGPRPVAPSPKADAGPLLSDPEATEELIRPRRPAPTEASIPADDPLGDYLDRMDEAFDRLQGEERDPAPRKVAGGRADADADAEGDIDSLEGALSALEGALDSLDPDDTPRASAPPAADPAVSDEAPRVTSSHAPPDDEGAAPPSPPEPPRAVPAPAAPPPAAAEPSSPAVPSPPAEPPPAVPAPALASEPPAPDPEPFEAPALAPSSAVARPSEPSVAPPARVAPPSLAEAFAALLAAERGEPASAPAVAWPAAAASPAVDDELIERVTERVVARLSDGVTGELVAQVVARVAEKLVRGELDRLKQS